MRLMSVRHSSGCARRGSAHCPAGGRSRTAAGSGACAPSPRSSAPSQALAGSASARFAASVCVAAPRGLRPGPARVRCPFAPGFAHQQAHGAAAIVETHAAGGVGEASDVGLDHEGLRRQRVAAVAGVGRRARGRHLAHHRGGERRAAFVDDAERGGTGRRGSQHHQQGREQASAHAGLRGVIELRALAAQHLALVERRGEAAQPPGPREGARQAGDDHGCGGRRCVLATSAGVARGRWSGAWCLHRRGIGAERGTFDAGGDEGRAGQHHAHAVGPRPRCAGVEEAVQRMLAGGIGAAADQRREAGDAEITTIWPRRCSERGQAACVHQAAPKKFTAITRRSTSGAASRSRLRAEMPALAISQSMPPRRCTTSAMAEWDRFGRSRRRPAERLVALRAQADGDGLGPAPSRSSAATRAPPCGALARQAARQAAGRAGDHDHAAARRRAFPCRAHGDSAAAGAPSTTSSKASAEVLRGR